MVHERPGLSVRELADEMGVSMPRVWQMVNRLERHGVRASKPPR